MIAERKDEAGGSYEIIDGLQRMHAILSFIETFFPTLEGSYFNLEHFPTAKGLADEGKFEATKAENLLTQRQVSTVLDYTLSLSVMRNATEEEINDVFGRINTYGHRLSDQERRQAGIQNAFSQMVRDIACTLRGDASADVLSLRSMPSISIDLPMTKHGYEVEADDVFWVNQGILRSTDLRDSMDEQCIADVAACVVGGALIERSKDALDSLYIEGDPAAEQIINALDVYGSDKFADEFKFCVDEILNICGNGTSTKLRDLIFKRTNTNAFPSVFAILLIAVHELIVGEGKKISDYAGAKTALTNIAERVETGRKATAPDERRKNIDIVKTLIGPSFVDANPRLPIYGNHTTTDIEALLRRSEIELSDYELKQGMLTLSDKREIDAQLIDKVICTICAIANNGPERDGKIIIGVSDKAADAARVKALDGIEAKKVGRRHVVGITREAKQLKISTEAYYAKWKEAIKNSKLSQSLKDGVLSHIDFNSFFGLGVIVITIPKQSALSFVGDDVYFRSGNSTEKASQPKTIADLAKRF